MKASDVPVMRPMFKVKTKISYPNVRRRAAFSAALPIGPANDGSDLHARQPSSYRHINGPFTQ